MRLGIPELLIILVLVLLIFGVGRISGVAGELGKSISEFRKGLAGSEKPDEEKKTENPEDKSQG
jgi:sec-independent protein translocase protein TatA